MLKLLPCINKLNYSFITTFVYPQEDNAFKQNLGGVVGLGNKVYHRQFQEMEVRIAEQFFFYYFSYLMIFIYFLSSIH